MDELQFKNALKKHDIILTEQQLNQFKSYYHLLVKWNEKVNLTAITEEKEVYLKHFYDSITASFYHPFKGEMTVCDIGAGAGFPSIPLKICFPDIKVTIVDSLKKRLTFLDELIDTLNLQDVELIHSRAEDLGKNKKFREHFDIVTARAVARMSVLAEYCLPLCKVEGKFIALKGSNSNKELADAQNAITLLGGKVIENNIFQLPIENSERSIIITEKIKKTNRNYPRQAGIPAKKPL